MTTIKLDDIITEILLKARYKLKTSEILSIVNNNFNASFELVHKSLNNLFINSKAKHVTYLVSDYETSTYWYINDDALDPENIIKYDI